MSKLMGFAVLRIDLLLQAHHMEEKVTVEHIFGDRDAADAWAREMNVLAVRDYAGVKPEDGPYSVQPQPVPLLLNLGVTR